MRKTFLFIRALWPLFAITLLLSGCATAPATAPAQAPIAPVKPAFTTPRLDLLNDQINHNPSDPQAYSNRGYVLALLGRKEEARADLRKTIDLKDNGPMHNRVGWAYFNNGDYADALRAFEKAAELSNHRAHYDYYSLVLGYWGTGDLKSALENYQLAVERDPRFGEFKTLNERTAEWTPLERRAIHEIYVLWNKTWKPQ
jgi:tetratricopeptide (TPR) repeat protein